MTPLPRAFLDRPIAHRGLHGPGVAENSVEAIAAARDAGYGIEIDVRMTADGVAVAFHDAETERLTGHPGVVRDFSAADLLARPLLDGGTIPDLATALAAAGDAPLLIEIKGDDGILGRDGAAASRLCAAALTDHTGPVAIMSFQIAAMREAARACPDRAVGLTTAFADPAWHGDPPPDDPRDFETGGPPPAFLSHDARELPHPRVAAFRASGRAVLTWTIRSRAEAARVRPHADQITFEGFRPDLAPAGAATKPPA